MKIEIEESDSIMYSAPPSPEMALPTEQPPQEIVNEVINSCFLNGKVEQHQVDRMRGRWDEVKRVGTLLEVTFYGTGRNK
jgi:hypothetical protein